MAKQQSTSLEKDGVVSMVVLERRPHFDVKTPPYPSIFYVEAQKKVKHSISTIDEGKGVSSDEFFAKMLAKCNTIV